LIGLTETLAIELGSDGIRVNAIAPGAVQGDRIQRVLRGRAEAAGRSLDDVTADALSIQSLKRFVDPADIASLALFLASDSAKSITGQTIPIDGGSRSAQ
jgi:NAD(P)-dependent dehydrogenase (short-subunit alcohol dehydrogenase family)